MCQSRYPVIIVVMLSVLLQIYSIDSTLTIMRLAPKLCSHKISYGSIKFYLAQKKFKTYFLFLIALSSTSKEGSVQYQALIFLSNYFIFSITNIIFFKFQFFNQFQFLFKILFFSINFNKFF